MSKHAFNILSIDGGGIRGIIPCTILRYIEDKTGLPAARLFNLLAGTSTGGIISLGLTMADKDGGNAYTADDMLKLYVEQGKYIFSRRPKDLLSWIGSALPIPKGLFDKDFDVAGFEKILAAKFDDHRLKDSLTDLLVTTYDPQDEKPFYFSSRLAKQRPEENFLLRDIARSTSAAPTYFKPALVNYEGKEKLALVDGGVFANNPSILAYSEGKELWKQRQYAADLQPPTHAPGAAKVFEAVVSPDDHDLPFFLLSIGCGHSITSIDYSTAADWRTTKWLKPLLTNVFMQSVSESTDYTMQHLLPTFEDGTPRYIRLNLQIPEANSQMDDASDENIQQLVAIANAYIASNKPKLNEICALLMK